VPARGGATIGAGGHAPPPFSTFSVFTLLTPPPSNALTPHLQIHGAALGASPNDLFRAKAAPRI